MRKSESIKELAGALNRVQAVLTGAKKDSSNPFFKSNYADLESVWDSIREVFTTNNLSIAQFPSVLEGRPALTNILMHTSGEWIEADVPVISGKEDAQGYVAAYTYFRRMSLGAIVGQVAVDDDGNGTRKEHATTAPAWKKPDAPRAAHPHAPDAIMPRTDLPAPSLPMFIKELRSAQSISALSILWTNNKTYLNGLSDADFAEAEKVKDELKAKLK